MGWRVAAAIEITRGKFIFERNVGWEWLGCVMGVAARGGGRWLGWWDRRNRSMEFWEETNHVLLSV